MGRSHLALYEQAVVIPSPVTDAVAAAARQYGMQVLLGVNERDGGTLYNTQLLFNSCGELVLKRAKISRRPITSGWSGAKVTARVSKWCRRRWLASELWPVGSTTTPWLATP